MLDGSKTWAGRPVPESVPHVPRLSCTAFCAILRARGEVLTYSACAYCRRHGLWNNMFFATDPVAVNCIMHDLIMAEPGTAVPQGRQQLSAAGSGLGAVIGSTMRDLP